MSVLPGIAIGSAIAGSVARKAGQLIDVGNAPNQLRSIGKVGDATLMNGTKPFDEIYQIDDWNIVADTYEKTGYRVDKIDSDSYRDPFDAFVVFALSGNRRYYYNPIQVSSIELDSKINIPADLMGNFEMRLKNGLRLWQVAHSDVNIGDFKYDNVEEAYI